MSNHENLGLGLNLELGATIYGAELGGVNRDAKLWPCQRHIGSHAILDLLPRRHDQGYKYKILTKKVNYKIKKISSRACTASFLACRRQHDAVFL